jgi:hypothetical protein
MLTLYESTACEFRDRNQLAKGSALDIPQTRNDSMLPKKRSWRYAPGI